MTNFIQLAVEGNVAVITLNRPEKLNAWNTEMRNEIIAALQDFNRQQTIGAIIMTHGDDQGLIMPRGSPPSRW